jgi:predicted metalloprotease with PDZ domain
MPPSDNVRYSVQPRPEANLYQVSCSVPHPDPGGQRFEMAAWVPGSYLIREFARNIVAIRADCGGRPVRLEKLDKLTWKAAPTREPVTVTCDVYAGELSVRTSHLDTSHAFIDGASLFLRAVGHESASCLVMLLPPEGERYRRWRVATTLPRRKAPLHGFGLYGASDYAELIDHPVEMGEFSRLSFDVLGVPHELFLTGRQRCDLKRLERDLKLLCEHHARFFGGPPPLDRYAFLLTVGEEEQGHGGLEHRSSSALICQRDALPASALGPPSENYRRLLRLCSHEYFHLWNVKRIVPAAFASGGLRGEAYTRQLWAFEGMTSYYGDLALVRSGVIPQQDLIDLLGGVMTSVMQGSGRLKQTLEEASFDAWIKAYRRDENAANALVSYYAKGELTALSLDLLIRRRTAGVRSLDDLMRTLWERHGRQGIPVPENGVETLASEVAGISLKRFFDLALRSTRELPLSRLLATVGISVRRRHARAGQRNGPGPGVTLGADTNSAGNQVTVSRVLDGGAARKAGLAAGDLLVALDGLRVTPRNLPRLLARYEVGHSATVHYFRRGELKTARFAFPPSGDAAWDFVFIPDAADETLTRRAAWLNG